VLHHDVDRNRHALLEAMTATEFRSLPLLVPQGEVIRCGVSKDLLPDLRFVVRVASDQVPLGRLGWVPCRPGARRGHYRKIDLAQFLGLPW
jgi:hypothetical protein